MFEYSGQPYQCKRCGVLTAGTLPIHCSCGAILDESDACETPTVGAKSKATSEAFVRRRRWPAWARAIAMLRTSDDADVGETAARCAKATGAASVAEWLSSIGFACGCDGRQERWSIYKYEDHNAND